jgi:hypothetical protein
MVLTDYQMGILSMAIHHGGAARADYEPAEIAPLMFEALIRLSEDQSLWLATPEGEALFYAELERRKVLPKEPREDTLQF